MTDTEYFERLRAAVSAGGAVNAPGGTSPLSDYLYFYYCGLYLKPDRGDDGQFLFPAELFLPLAARPAALAAHLGWFFEHGADPNAGKDDFPLMRTVGNADAALTEYLLDRGADPFYGGDGSGLLYSSGNWYIDALDDAMLQESFAARPDRNRLTAILNTAAVLARRGVTVSGRFCLSVDPETRTASCRRPDAERGKGDAPCCGTSM